MTQKGLIFALLIMLVWSPLGAKDKTIVRSISKEDMLLLREVDQKYQKQHGIHLQLKKTITLGMLGSQKTSHGEVWLKNGKMKLVIDKPQPSKIVAGSQFLWIESAPPEDFEGAKVQVLRASLNSKQAKSQGFIQLLTQGGVLKYFRVSGIQKEDQKVRFFLQPDQQSVEFKRAQIEVNPKTKVIRLLRYWDQMDNETTFEFSKSEFNLKLAGSVFQYSPPKNAEVITY